MGDLTGETYLSLKLGDFAGEALDENGDVREILTFNPRYGLCMYF